MFWLGALADRRHPRQAISISLAVVAGGAMCLALAPAAGWLLVGIFLLRLGGQGLTGHIAIVTAARHGGARRGRIIAIAVLGFILAEATLPFVITTLPALQHWRWTWGTVAGIVLVVALPAMRRIAAPLPDRAAEADAPTTTEATMTRASLFANRKRYIASRVAEATTIVYEICSEIDANSDCQYIRAAPAAKPSAITPAIATGKLWICGK